MSPLFSSQQSVWVIRDYSHGETLGNGVKWEHFPARGGKRAGVLVHLLLKSLVKSGRGIPSSIISSGVTLQVCTPAVAGRPSHRRGRRQGEKSPQIELGTSIHKVGTPKVRGMHMRRCYNSSDKFITTWGPAQAWRNASRPPWEPLVALWKRV